MVFFAIFQSFLLSFGLFSVGPPGRGLIELFFGILFRWTPWKFFCRRPWSFLISLLWYLDQDTAKFTC